MERTKVSLSFSKKIEKKKLAPSAIRAPVEKKVLGTSAQIIESIEENKIVR